MCLDPLATISHWNLLRVCVCVCLCVKQYKVVIPKCVMWIDRVRSGILPGELLVKRYYNKWHPGMCECDYVHQSFESVLRCVQVLI